MPERRQTWRPDLPLPVRMKSGRALVARAVLFEAIGWDGVTCHWCGRALQWLPKGHADAIEADHLNGDVTDDDPANLAPADRYCNQHRGQGILWWTLRDHPGANWPEIWRWGPIKTTFPCGHPFDADNIWENRAKREHLCLTCHRRRGREYWRKVAQR